VARAIPPWLHRILLRDYGPGDPFITLVVFVVNSFMDDSGSCFPSQETIAQAAGMGVSTVRRKIGAANRAHWLSIEARAVYVSRHWKQYSYRACCPEAINLEGIALKDKGQTAAYLADAHESVYGGIDGANLTGTLFPQPGRKKRIPPAASGRTQSEAAPSTAPSMLPARAPPAAVTRTARSRNEDRPLRLGAPPAAGYEVPNLSLKSKSQYEGALTRTDGDSDEGLRAKIKALGVEGFKPNEIVKQLAQYGVSGDMVCEVGRESGCFEERW
jgi:hypothetical protein